MVLEAPAEKASFLGFLFDSKQCREHAVRHTFVLLPLVKVQLFSFTDSCSHASAS